MNPILSLFRSRKFLLLLLDTTISILAYYNAVDPAIIAILQPVVIAVILGIAHEDAAEKRGGQIAAAGDVTVTNVSEGHMQSMPTP
jgi:hypothetical protein